MSTVKSLSFPNLLNEYLDDPCVKPQLLDLVLNSDVETKFSSFFNIWINQNYKKEDIISLTEVDKIDQILLYFNGHKIVKIVLVEYGHKLSQYESNLPKSITEKILSDVYKIFNKRGKSNPKIESLINRLFDEKRKWEQPLLSAEDVEIEIYHTSLISELKISDWLKNSFDNLFNYRKLWLTYYNEIKFIDRFKSEYDIKNNYHIMKKVNAYAKKNNPKNTFESFAIYKNVELREVDVYLNIVLIKVELFGQNKSEELKSINCNFKSSDIKFIKIINNIKQNEYFSSELSQLIQINEKGEVKIKNDSITKKILG